MWQISLSYQQKILDPIFWGIILKILNPQIFSDKSEQIGSYFFGEASWPDFLK